MTIQDAVLEAVRDAVPGASIYDGSGYGESDVVVFDAVVPEEPPRRYLFVTVDNGTDRAGQVSQESTGSVLRWQVTAVGPDRQQAGWLASGVKRGITDVRVAVDGWRTGMVEHTFSQLPQRDDTILDRVVVYAIDQYRLLAERTE